MKYGAHRSGIPELQPSARHGARGFTLVELLVSIAILTLVMSVTYGIFAATTKAWQRGKIVSESLQHGDFIMEQLVMGLRSAFFRNAGSGFWLTDGGYGHNSSDTISWVKLGPTLVGARSEVAKGAHRVKFTVEPIDGAPAATVRAWSPESYLQPDEFDTEKVEPVILSRHIVGFNCRIGSQAEGGVIEWNEEWENTNTLPQMIELTLYIKPRNDDEEPIEMRRCVSIPVGKSAPSK